MKVSEMDWDDLRNSAHELPDLIDDFLQEMAGVNVSKANNTGGNIIAIAAQIQLAVAQSISDPGPPT